MGGGIDQEPIGKVNRDLRPESPPAGRRALGTLARSVQAQLFSRISKFISQRARAEYGGWNNIWISDAGPWRKTGRSFENVSNPSRD